MAEVNGLPEWPQAGFFFKLYICLLDPVERSAEVALGNIASNSHGESALPSFRDTAQVFQCALKAITQYDETKAVRQAVHGRQATLNMARCANNACELPV